ncbi:tetratricopeptide repeat protein [Halobacteriovorax sp.]|uniref:tetratricopeptide repeat protein n=1 Tax=Halobacteriovorax sp. TaxID=2020862 RepID=UPI003564792F
MYKAIKLTAFATLLTSITSCGFVNHIEERSAQINQQEDMILQLSKEKRDLNYQITKLKTEIAALETKNQFLTVQLKESSGQMPNRSRTVASVAPTQDATDLVQYDVYKWKPDQVLAVAQKEFSLNNFEKSAQFFYTFKKQFPESKKMNDQFLFQAGVASFESGKHYNWAISSFQKLIDNYPTSKFYRGSKLWMALANLKMGNEDKFFSAAEEFRKKYRNTPEWKILSTHYEKIVQRHKKN